MLLFLRVSFLKTLLTHQKFTSTDLVPEKGKILSTDDWSKSWKISFELKVNAKPASHQNILHVSKPNGALVVSLYPLCCSLAWILSRYSSWQRTLRLLPPDSGIIPAAGGPTVPGCEPGEVKCADMRINFIIEQLSNLNRMVYSNLNI